jgi:hypothetical protein
VNDDIRRRAHEELSEEIAKNAEPHVARALTSGRSTQVTSEEAHRIAAEAARQHDRKQGR